MIKKSDLRVSFEAIVRSVKSARFCVKMYFRGKEYYVSRELPVTDWDLRIERFDRSFKIMLYAKNGRIRETVVATSYPFPSYKSAYQTLVRL